MTYLKIILLVSLCLIPIKRKENLTVMLLATTDEIATAKAARESFMIR
jgi:hypothetical protein